MASYHLVLLSIAFLAISTTTTSQDITNILPSYPSISNPISPYPAVSTTAYDVTDILSSYPEYSQFRDYLILTGLDSLINSCETVTVLVIPNSAMPPLTHYPLRVKKYVLSLHVLVYYFDENQLRNLPDADGTILCSTLYETIGNTTEGLGTVNITNLEGGTIGFGYGIAGSKLDCTYTKTIFQIDQRASLLEVSSLIDAPTVLTAGAESSSSPTSSIPKLLEKSGCKTFANLIESSGVLKVYQSQFDKGLTMFVPDDEAFNAKGLHDQSKLSKAELVSLLQYHTISGYHPDISNMTKDGEIKTLASNNVDKYVLTVKTHTRYVFLDTGVDTSMVNSTLLDADPVVILTVYNVLLPHELNGKISTMAPTPAPAPATALVLESDSPSEGPSPDESKSSHAAADKANDAVSVSALKLLSLLASTIVAAIVLS